MRKKIKIIFSCLVAVIILVTVLSFTVFGLKKVEVDYRMFVNLSVEQKDKIIESGKFAFNKPIMFQNKKLYIKNLEKNNPYLKIVNIETIFPNKLVVHCVEREEVFAIKSGNKYFFLSADLKILRVFEGEFSSEQNNAILIAGEFTIQNANATAGDFLMLSVAGDVIKTISPAFAVNNRDIAEQKGYIKSINVGFRIAPVGLESKVYFEFEDFLGFKVKVMEVEDSLNEKINALLACQASLSIEEIKLNSMQILKDSKGKIFSVLTPKS